MAKNKTVGAAAWAKARAALLKKEKAFTKKRDQLAAERAALPWVKVDKDYVFEGPQGKVRLADLFGKKSQLVVYHFMFGPEQETGCPSCSLLADNFDRSAVHLAARDVAFVAVSRAPLKKLQAFKKRLGWSFDWVSSLGSDFNFDFEVSTKEATEFGTESPGVNVFVKDGKGQIYRTYSNYDRGLEDFMATYRYLDIVPKGRDEEKLPYGMAWVKYNDQY